MKNLLHKSVTIIALSSFCLTVSNLRAMEDVIGEEFDGTSLYPSGKGLYSTTSSTLSSAHGHSTSAPKKSVSTKVIPFSPTHWSFPIPPKALCVIGVAIPTIWALVERKKKNNAYKNHEQDQHFLSECATHLEKIHNQYKAWNQFLADNQSIDSIEEPFIQKSLILLAQSEPDARSTLQAIDTHLQDTIHKRNVLRTKQAEWDKSVRTHYRKQAHSILKQLNKQIESLQTARDLIVTLQPYISLVCQSDSIAQNYAWEINLNPQAPGAGQQLDTHIRMQHTTKPFSYVTYADHLQNRCQSLDTAIQHTSRKSVPFQEATKRAQGQLQALQRILAFVVTSDEYKQQCTNKTVYDQNEERLRMELSERQARIDQDNRRAHAKLQAERNKAQKLENAQAEIQKQLRLTAQLEQQARLELEKIRDQKNIKEAVDKKDKERQREVAHIKKEWQREVADIKRKIINNNDQEWKSKWQHSLEKLKAELERISQNISSVQEMTTRPPCNPAVVEGLSDYIQNIQLVLQRIKSDLNSIQQHRL